MSFISKLQKGVYDVTGKVFANWTPQDPIDLGDIGRLSGSRFQKDTTLQSRGYQFQRTSDRLEGSLEYKRSVVIESKISAKASADDTEGLRTEVDMKFGSEGSFVYHLSNLTYDRFEDRRNVFEWLGINILDGSVKWLDDYVLIDEIRRADQASVIVSDSADASLNFDCVVDADDTGFLAKLGAEAGASIKSAQIMHFVGLKEPALFYHPIELEFDPGPGPGPISTALGAVKELFLGEPVSPGKINMTEYVENEEDRSIEATFSVNGNGEIKLASKALSVEAFISREQEEKADIPVAKEKVVVAGKRAFG